MQLNFKVFGQGEALIILHGLFGSLDNWVSHARTLSKQFTVFIIDQRNHGNSPHADTWSYELMAEDLYGFMVEQGIPQAHILGHSMGGKTAMQFAAWYPELILKMIVLDMAPKAYEPHHTQILKGLSSLPILEIQNREEADQFLKQYIPEESVRLFLLKGLKRNNGGGFRWKFNLDVINKLYVDILKELDISDPVDIPTFFLSGQRSEYLLPEDHQAIEELFTKVRFQAIPNAGHWVHAEQPEAFIAACFDFLGHD